MTETSTPTGGASSSDCAEPSKPAARTTPSTFEACEGYWDLGPYLDRAWMRRDGDVCLLGGTTKLYADGRVTRPDIGEYRWTGDAFYVTFDDGKGSPHVCKRLPNKPSER